MNHIETKNLSVLRETTGEIPDIPWETIKNSVLGKKYDLSLVFPTTEHATKLHIEYEQKQGPANILSFPYEDDEGEIFMHLQTLRCEAVEFAHTYNEHLVFMFIHGCSHLKGYDHGEAMEVFEKKHRNKFLPGLTH
jgi:rRNA maturation RNase YbeY